MALHILEFADTLAARKENVLQSERVDLDIPLRALITVLATLSYSGSTPQLAVVDSKVLGVDQRIAKSQQTSNEVSDRKTALLRLCRLHA